MNTALQMDLIVFPFDIGDRVTVHTDRHPRTDGKIQRLDRKLGYFWVKPDAKGKPIIGPVIEPEMSLRGLHE